MTDSDPWKELGSRLPSEGAYWRTLEERVMSDADEVLSQYRERQGMWWMPIARYSGALVSAAVAAVLGAVLFVSLDDVESDGLRSEVASQALVLTDPDALRLFDSDVPPSLEALVFMPREE